MIGGPDILLEPLVLRWGVPYGDTLTLYDDEAGTSPVDLTGLKVTANLHSGSPEDPGESAFDISTDNGLLIVSDPTTGVIQFDLDADAVTEIPAGDYIMCVFLKDLSDVVIANGHPLIWYVQVVPSGAEPTGVEA